MSEQMNIYLINFNQEDYGLSAVVVADSIASAVNIINEQLEPESVGTIFHLGIANSGLIPRIVCCESL